VAGSSTGWPGRRWIFSFSFLAGDRFARKWIKMTTLKTLVAGLLALAALASSAQEAAIRKNIAERLPQIKKLDEVTASPIPGLYELRINDSEIFYTDADANFLIEGSLIDLRLRKNLTEERIAKLTAMNFDELPIKDAVTVVRGNGKRKLAVFEDPNCGYCKRFERDLEKVTNVTIHTFLYPILTPDSSVKSKNIWCARDKSKVWQDWMLKEQTPANVTCDVSAITRNLELGRKHKITGTPTLVFADGSRVPGAITTAQIEKYLNEIK
jgi:thiol:disulfide interchange protein DsbC